LIKSRLASLALALAVAPALGNGKSPQPVTVINFSPPADGFIVGKPALVYVTTIAPTLGTLHVHVPEGVSLRRPANCKLVKQDLLCRVRRRSYTEWKVWTTIDEIRTPVIRMVASITPPLSAGVMLGKNSFTLRWAQLY